MVDSRHYIFLVGAIDTAYIYTLESVDCKTHRSNRNQTESERIQKKRDPYKGSRQNDLNVPHEKA